MKKVLFVIAPINFRDEELFIPKDILEENNCFCDIISTTATQCTGKLGRTIVPTITAQSVKVDNYAAIAIIGGPGAPVLGENKEIISIILTAHKLNKLIAAICIAPIILAKLNLLNGRNATVFPSGKNVLIEHNCNYINKPVVLDERKPMILTANGPESAKEFGEKLLSLIN